MKNAGAAAVMICPACNSRYEEGVTFCAKDGSALVRDVSAGKVDFVGQVLADRYRIVSLIGEGGMGQVYEAQHVNINKRFAVKLLRPEIVSNGEAVARFRQEAWSASSIGHENIVEIEDFATLPSGAVYLAMEYLAGQSLSERMKAGPPIELEEALDVLLQVCRGLAAAHEKSIIHRDMKPENIFLAEKYGRLLVKILDFGIAKVSGAEGSPSLTRTGTIFGTPHYMSPEQALGKPLDHRSDIYSVGVIMFEVFTGRVPFEAESFMGILTKHITTAPPRPSEIAPNRHIPEAIEHMILRAMSKEPIDRQSTMAELLEELTAIASEVAPGILRGTTSPQFGATGARPIARSPSGAQRPVGQRTPSGLQRAPSGTHRSPFDVQPFASTVASGSSSGLPRELQSSALEVPRRRGLGLALVGFGVLVVGAAALFFLRPAVRTPDEKSDEKLARAATAPSPATKPVAAIATPTLQPKVEAAGLAPVAAAAVEEVIIDSIPTGADLLRDGKVFADTPEVIKLPTGTTAALVIRKDGFVDAPVTVDPARGHKITIRLERVKSAHAPHKTVQHTPLPLPPPEVAPVLQKPVLVNKPSPPTQKARRRPVDDPYERLDDTPKKNSDVLNPY